MRRIVPITLAPVKAIVLVVTVIMEVMESQPKLTVATVLPSRAGALNRGAPFNS